MRQQMTFFQAATSVVHFRNLLFVLLAAKESLSWNLPHLKDSRVAEPTRRAFLQCAVASVLLVEQTSFAPPSNAACLPGDTSDSCIGVYKVPIDDEILDYIDTPEKLLKYAPDVNWVEPVRYPPTVRDARRELQQLQPRIESLKSKALNGDITLVGKEILEIWPRITVAGRVVVQGLENAKDKAFNSRAYRTSVAHDEVLNSFGECDVLIGQGIRGDLGSLTVAQIYIIQNLDEITTNYVIFLNSIPKDFVG